MRPENLIDAFRPAKGAPPRTLWAFFRWALQGAWPVIIVGAMISAFAGGLEVMTSLLLGLIIDRALDTGPETFFDQNWTLIAGFAVFFIFLRPTISGMVAGANSIVIGPNLSALVLSRLHRWTMGQSVSFFDDDFAGRISQKQLQTARALTDVVNEVVNVVSFALSALIGSALLLATIDWRIGLALAIWLCGYFALIRYFLPKVRVRSAARAGARSAVSGQIVDTITNIKTVKLFALAEHEDRAALGAMKGYREKAIHFGRMATAFRFGLMTVAGTLPVLLIGGALVLWSQGMATAGDIAAAGSVAIRIAQMTGWVSFTLMAIYSNVGEVENGMQTLTPPHDLTDQPDAVALPASKGDIAFDNVGFAYGRQNGGVQAINLSVKPGEKLGIVGASGAGKSTLVSLLLRLYDTEEGRILIDGTDISTVTQESLRQQIAMVTQETAMFNRSARDNILYGRPDATMDDVIAAAEKAEAHEFITQLVDGKGRSGYDAHLGERGVKLSGGQRQRIALARAFLKDAPILVLDEATSALDSEVEASIQGALERAMVGKTVLAIAHRLSTLVQMDRIVVLDGGHIVEEGTHDELRQAGGIYAGFWERQSGGFINVQDAAE